MTTIPTIQDSRPTGSGGGGSSGGLTDAELRATPVPVEQDTPGTLSAGVQVSATGTAGTLIAANANRKQLIVQNIDTAEYARIGIATVTTTTGIRIGPGATLILDSPYCPTALIQCIREGSTSLTLLVSEITG
jgi:hypothetical protein